ncbi:hypothetical protein E2C01_004767 [Portunus trituberculatus]|uniref:Uncharacterized protein n=1 Tax=Portunus trituberculatus TaxID=210409 RepID=A0A5B7CRF0_PORTR|nr:hypothetical protein [Portunus trituberculatus]
MSLCVGGEGGHRVLALQHQSPAEPRQGALTTHHSSQHYHFLTTPLCTPHLALLTPCYSSLITLLHSSSSPCFTPSYSPFISASPTYLLSASFPLVFPLLHLITCFTPSYLSPISNPPPINISIPGASLPSLSLDH